MSNNPLSNFSYTNKDFNSTYKELLDFVKQATYKWDPTISNESDPGVILIKLNAIIADKNNYNIDKNILEAFPQTLTQDQSARSIYTQLGYKPRWYQSATGKVYLEWVGKGDYTLKKTTEPIIIPKDTYISSFDDSKIYILLNDVILNYTNRNAVADVIEGTLNDLTIAGNRIISLANLDYHNRIYFPESTVAENGIYISNKNSENAYWKCVNNLQVCQDGTKCYEFGIDPVSGLCYIEFPQDIAELIEDGICIKYITTNGYEGNILSKQISKIYSSVSTSVFGESIPINTDVIKIYNPSDFTNGKNPETLEESYQSFKQTIGTFDTLITLRDYFNAIVNSNLVSNAMVCDRTNDLQSVYTIVNEDENEITNFVTQVGQKRYSSSVQLVQLSSVYKGNNAPSFYNIGAVYSANRSDTPTNLFYNYFVVMDEPANWDTEWKNYYTLSKFDTDDLEAFDLKFYLLHKPNYMNNLSEYESSFNLEEPNNTVNKKCEFYINSNKSIQHNIKEILPDIPCLFTNEFPLELKIVPTIKLNEYQRKILISNVKNALITNLNSKKLTIGEELSYDTIYNIIVNADERIKILLMNDFKYTTYATYWESNKDKANGGSFKKIPVSNFNSMYIKEIDSSKVPYPPLPGFDVNKDGYYDELDVVYLDRYLAEWDGYTIDKKATDFNHDGVVDEIDDFILTRIVDSISVTKNELVKILLQYYKDVNDFNVFKKTLFIINDSITHNKEVWAFSIDKQDEFSIEIPDSLGADSKTLGYLNLYSNMIDKFRLDIITKNILAGVTPLFNVNTDFVDTIDQSSINATESQYVNTYLEIKPYGKGIDLNKNLNATYKLRANENLRFLAPSLSEEQAYGGYTKYQLILNPEYNQEDTTKELSYDEYYEDEDTYRKTDIQLFSNDSLLNYPKTTADLTYRNCLLNKDTVLNSSVLDPEQQDRYVNLSLETFVNATPKLRDYTDTTIKGNTTGKFVFPVDSNTMEIPFFTEVDGVLKGSMTGISYHNTKLLGIKVTGTTTKDKEVIVPSYAYRLHLNPAYVSENDKITIDRIYDDVILKDVRVHYEYVDLNHNLLLDRFVSDYKVRYKFCENFDIASIHFDIEDIGSSSGYQYKITLNGEYIIYEIHPTDIIKVNGNNYSIVDYDILANTVTFRSNTELDLTTVDTITFSRLILPYVYANDLINYYDYFDENGAFVITPPESGKHKQLSFYNEDGHNNTTLSAEYLDNLDLSNQYLYLTNVPTSSPVRQIWNGGNDFTEGSEIDLQKFVITINESYALEGEEYTAFYLKDYNYVVPIPYFDTASIDTIALDENAYDIIIDNVAKAVLVKSKSGSPVPQSIMLQVTVNSNEQNKLTMKIDSGRDYNYQFTEATESGPITNYWDSQWNHNIAVTSNLRVSDLATDEVMKWDNNQLVVLYKTKVSKVNSNSSYMLKKDESLLLFYKTETEDNAPYTVKIYKEGAIFTATTPIIAYNNNNKIIDPSPYINLIKDDETVGESKITVDNKDYSKIVNDLNYDTLIGDSTITEQRLNQIILKKDDGNRAYFITRNIFTDTNDKIKKFKLIANKVPDQEPNSIPHYSYIMDNDEYFIHFNELSAQFEVLGAGTQIIFSSSTFATMFLEDDKAILTLPFVSYTSLAEEGSSSIGDKALTINDDLTIRQMQIYNFSENDDVTFRYIGADEEPKELIFKTGTYTHIKDYEVTYKSVGNQGILSGMTMTNAIATDWVATSVLNINVTPDTLQEIEKDNDYTKSAILCMNTCIDGVPYTVDSSKMFPYSYLTPDTKYISSSIPINKVAGFNTDITTYDDFGNIKFPKIKEVTLLKEFETIGTIKGADNKILLYPRNLPNPVDEFSGYKKVFEFENHHISDLNKYNKILKIANKAYSSVFNLEYTKRDDATTWYQVECLNGITKVLDKPYVMTGINEIAQGTQFEMSGVTAPDSQVLEVIAEPLNEAEALIQGYGNDSYYFILPSNDDLGEGECLPKFRVTVLSTKEFTINDLLVIYPIFNFTNNSYFENTYGISSELILQRIEELDFNKKFNYTLNIDVKTDASKIYDPLDPVQFFNENHVFNKFTISMADLDFGNSTQSSIKLTSTKGE